MTTDYFAPWDFGSDDEATHRIPIKPLFRPFESDEDEPVPPGVRSRSPSNPSRGRHAAAIPPPVTVQPPTPAVVPAVHRAAHADPTVAPFAPMQQPGLNTPDVAEPIAEPLQNAGGSTRFEDWRTYEVRASFRQGEDFFNLPPGIINMELRHCVRELRRPSRCEGRIYRLALADINWILRRGTCEFKIGLAQFLGSRWLQYQEDENTWTPHWLCKLCATPDRVSAGFMESGLIFATECLDIDHPRFNINYRNKDRGGTGPRSEVTMRYPHYIYLAVKPCIA